MFNEGELVAGVYEILSNIVDANNREVYLAYHNGLQKNVIIKKVFDNLSDSVNIDSEMDDIKSLKHACLPETYDFIRNGSRLYSVSEYIVGKSLVEIIVAGHMVKEKRIVKWLSQIAAALDYLHSQRKAIVHSDIKPSNIIIDDDDNVCLVGANYVFGGDDTELVADITLPYASPEQYKKASLFYNGQNHRKITLDGRSDMYSVACVLYQIMTMNLPQNPDLDNIPLSSWQLSYSPQLIHVIDKAMSKNVSDRYTDMVQMISDIDKYRNKLENADSASRRRKIGILSAVGVAVIIGAVIACVAIDKMNIRTRYNKCIAAAEKAVKGREYDTAWDKYGEAIGLDAGKGKPYIDIISSVILADAGFDSYENQKMNQIFTKERLEELKKHDSDSYYKVMYDIGNAYYFLYSNEVIGRILAKDYFNIAKESNALSEKEKNRAESLYEICEYSEELRAFNSKNNGIDVDFNSFWDNLTGILNIEYDLNSDRMLAAKSYEVFYQYAWKYKNEFIKAGISNKDILNSLKEVKEQLLNIQKLENTSTMLPMSIDIKSDIENLDYNISQLVKTINSVGTSDHVDIDTLYFSYELGSYLRSVLDYDDEHSIRSIVSDLEVIIKDRYKVTECQVVVFNGLDEQQLLVEGRDYSFELMDENAYIDDEGANGFKYAVNIHSNVFSQEGTYTVIIYAKDSLADKKYGEEAPLISNTEVPAANILLKADNITFTIDRSEPEITVSGAVDGSRYKSDRELRIGYADICDISSISIEVTDGVGTIDKVAYSAKDLDVSSEKNGYIYYTVKEHQKYQNVSIHVRDISGNESVYEMKILITSSFLNKVMNNRPLVIGSVIALAIVLTVVIIGVDKLKKNK